MQVGVQAKGVLMMRVDVPGTAAHGATPWLGDNAVLRAVDLFRRISGLPFASESAPLFERPSINLGRIQGGDAVNKVPDLCRMDVDVRYLPGQSPDEVLRQVRALDAEARLEVLLERPPADVPPDHVFVQALLAAASAPRAVGHLGGARRRLRRRGLPRGGRPRGRVRPARGRTPRPRGVRRDREPAPLPPRARRLRASRGGPARHRPSTPRSPPRDAARPSRRTSAPATGASRAAAAGGSRWSAGRLWAIVGLGVSVLAGGYIYLDDTLEAGRAQHAPGQGGPGGHQAGAPGRADQHPADRLGHAPLRGRPRAQRLADPGADGPPARLHLDAVVPARPLRADPRLRHRQDQRGLLARRRRRRSRRSRSSPASRSTTT